MGSGAKMTDRIFTDANGRKYINNEPRLHPPQRKPEITSDYERGFVDGMSEQARRSVDRAVNAMVSSKAKPLTGQEYADIYVQCADWDDFARAIERAHGIK